jgi:hypothetical protein
MGEGEIHPGMFPPPHLNACVEASIEGNLDGEDSAGEKDVLPRRSCWRGHFERFAE